MIEPIVAGRADLVIGSRAPRRRRSGVAHNRSSRSATGCRRFSCGCCTAGASPILGPFRAIRWPALESLRMRDSRLRLDGRDADPCTACRAVVRRGSRQLPEARGAVPPRSRARCGVRSGRAGRSCSRSVGSAWAADEQPAKRACCKGLRRRAGASYPRIQSDATGRPCVHRRVSPGRAQGPVLAGISGHVRTACRPPGPRGSRGEPLRRALVWSTALGFLAAAFVGAVLLSLYHDRQIAYQFFLHTAIWMVPTFALVTSISACCATATDTGSRRSTCRRS